MNSGIVFDLDGTLITCENKQKFVLYSILNSYTTIAPEVLNNWWELKRSGFNTEQALTLIGISEAKFITDKWVKLVENFTFCSLDIPFQDSLSSLEYLKTNQISPVAILTARFNAPQVYQAVSRFGFDKYIDDVIVVKPNEAIERKENYLKKIKPILYIGDSELDQLAAQKSDTKFVALSRGQRSEMFLRKNGIIQIEKDLKFLKNDSFFLQLQTSNSNFSN